MHALRDEYGASMQKKTATLPAAMKEKRKKQKKSIEDLPAIGQKRVLLTRWVAQAAAEMHLRKKECWKYFEKTGLLRYIILQGV